MASVAFEKTDEDSSLSLPTFDRQGWGFLLLVLTTSALFVRPADLVPELEEWPLYQFAIVSCLVVSARTVKHQLSNQNILRQPVLASLIWLLVAVALSHLAHGFFWAARMSLVEVAKVVALYVLILGLVNTPFRIIKFVQWLTISITSVAGLALLDRYGYFTIAALGSIRDRGVQQAGEEAAVFVERIRGTGIFQDPNDFGLILVTGLVLSVSFLLRPGAGWLRHFWLFPCVVLLTTIALTHSRGAMLSLVCAVPAGIAYCRSLYVGIVSLAVIPLLALFFSARMTDVDSMVEGTGQSRIHIWSESITVWKQFPVFGLGEGLLFDELGMVTHNSFLHCFAELGLFGGSAFVTCFLAAGMGLWRLRAKSMVDSERPHADSDLTQVAHHRIYIFAALVAYAAGILTLSRQFVVPTYLVLGLATAAFTVDSDDTPRVKLNSRFWATALLVSLFSLFAFYVTVRIFIRR